MSSTCHLGRLREMGQRSTRSSDLQGSPVTKRVTEGSQKELGMEEWRDSEGILGEGKVTECGARDITPQ